MIRRIAERRYEVRVYVGADSTNGKKKEHRISRTVRSLAEAKRLEAQLKTQSYAGELIATRPPTVGELVERTLEHCAPDWSVVHAEQMRSIADRLIIPTLGTTRLNKLNPMLLDATYRQWQSVVAPSSVRKAHVLLSRSCAQAVRWGMLATNPVRHATAPRSHSRTVEPPTPAEVTKLLAEAEPDLSLFLRLAITTGARRGELCALHWSNLDASGLTIRASIYAARGVVAEKLPKSGKVRRVDLDARSLELLAAHRVRAESLAGQFRCKLAKNAYVFSDLPDGSRPWRPDDGAYSALRKRCGLEHVRLHDLRHASATWQFAAGIAPHTISARLGHASKAMTFDTYGHARSGDGLAAADTLAELLDG